jgi:hypothetical protein
MAKREIVQYILENSKRGFSSQRIRQSLLAQGWSDYDIEEGFRYIRDGNQRLPEKNTVFTTGSFFESGFFKLILGVLILIAFVVLILLILPERESFSISDFSNNTSLEISKENAKIKLGEEGKVMKLSKSGNRIDYSFNGSEGVLLVGEELNFDLEGDGEYDFFMRYESVNEENFPVLFFGEYVPCVPEWVCGNWGECINEIQTRNCIDENSCGSLEGRPVVKEICVVEEEKVIVENETELNGTEVNESVGNQTGINWSEYVEERDFIDCGNDKNYTCLINASQDCHPAKANITSYLDLFGIITNSAFYVELRGYAEDGRCVLYSDSVVLNQSMTEEFREYLAENYTLEEINEMEAELNSYSTSYEQVCGFENDSLTLVLEKWSEGHFSTSDYDNAICSPHDNYDCKLRFEGAVLEGLGMAPGGSLTLSVKGFSSEENVVWEVENDSVYSLSSNQGSSSTLNAISIGETKITIIDEGVDSCGLSGTVEVY